VRASWSLPGLFRPVHYRHRYLVDGGVVDYVPVDAAKLLGAEWIIASVTEGDFTKSNPKNVLSTLEQIFDIRGKFLSREQKKQANIVIAPDVGNVRFYDVKRSRAVMEKGVEAAFQNLSHAKENLILFTLPRMWKQWSAN
jgi:NTE family protein